MSRISLVLVMAALMTLIACGGGQRMTVEEYAAACAGLEDQFPSGDSFEFGFMEAVLDEIKSWNPPAELEEFHRLNVKAVEFAIGALSDSRLLEMMGEIEEAQQNEDVERRMELVEEMGQLLESAMELEDEMTDLQNEIDRARQQISPKTFEILQDSGCALLE
jgi:hypothetical protein